MWKAVFKVDLSNKDFAFEKGKKYTIELEDDRNIYVRQPNSPKNKNWVTCFDKLDQPLLFDMVEEGF